MIAEVAHALYHRYYMCVYCFLFPSPQMLVYKRIAILLFDIQAIAFKHSNNDKNFIQHNLWIILRDPLHAGAYNLQRISAWASDL